MSEKKGEGGREKKKKRKQLSGSYPDPVTKLKLIPETWKSHSVLPVGASLAEEDAELNQNHSMFITWENLAGPVWKLSGFL